MFFVCSTLQAVSETMWKGNVNEAMFLDAISNSKLFTIADVIQISQDFISPSLQKSKKYYSNTCTNVEKMGSKEDDEITADLRQRLMNDENTAAISWRLSLITAPCT